ncbi:DUF4102 domain-containing protein [Escherichia coli]|jgi:hypothetical protein|nr:DUF4102 domain-containing protein [Escherichia coli]EIA34092.1 hypothetical protein OQA_21536 [Escherichia coli SCI-07]EEV9094222.1 DUF4102 domain-containing protein [Escherichia coli]EEW1442120.1 DUF4102 domain-containing protein [Escherichia coli]EEW1930898.1 DUF4102 domain-containing protein [Escherichia coli]
MASLAEACKRHDAAKKLVSDGIDPSQKKKRKRLQKAER